jgi:hypothetical protein
MAKQVAYHMKLKVEYLARDKALTATVETYAQGWDKARTSLSNESTNTKVVEVVNGKSGWTKRGDAEAQAMADEKVSMWHELMYANHISRLIPLKNREFDLTPLDEISVEGRPAVGILVRHDGHEAIKFYFDKESHLAVKTWRRMMNVDLHREVVSEGVLLDYRDVNGEKHPFKTISYRDGAKTMESTVMMFESFDKPLDDKLFEKP